MKSLVKLLKGKKTYLIGAVTLGYGMYLAANGDIGTGADKIIIGLLALTGRAAVKKAQPAEG